MKNLHKTNLLLIACIITQTAQIQTAQEQNPYIKFTFKNKKTITIIDPKQHFDALECAQSTDTLQITETPITADESELVCFFEMDDLPSEVAFRYAPTPRSTPSPSLRALAVINNVYRKHSPSIVSFSPMNFPTPQVIQRSKSATFDAQNTPLDKKA